MVLCCLSSILRAGNSASLFMFWHCFCMRYRIFILQSFCYGLFVCSSDKRPDINLPEALIIEQLRPGVQEQLVEEAAEETFEVGGCWGFNGDVWWFLATILLF